MQEDKVPVFEAFDALELALAAMTGMVADLKPNRERDGRRGRRRLRHRHRPRRLAGARGWACRSARPTTWPARR